MFNYTDELIEKLEGGKMRRTLFLGLLPVLMVVAVYVAFFPEQKRVGVLHISPDVSYTIIKIHTFLHYKRSLDVKILD